MVQGQKKSKGGKAAVTTRKNKPVETMKASRAGNRLRIKLRKNKKQVGVAQIEATLLGAALTKNEPMHTVKVQPKPKAAPKEDPTAKFEETMEIEQPTEEK
eukprot:GDKI01042403.1.p1 GENE.GDKI01042403.1~~GDKI01042403.1.p1  ORF type:complete len:101 (-),score=39.80 GDKI01042403.1:194-496(-)